MSELATTKMSSKGQVVIPERVRIKLGLRTGVQFVVVGSPGVVVLKTIAPPDLTEFDGLIADARRQARRAGMDVCDCTLPDHNPAIALQGRNDPLVGLVRNLGHAAISVISAPGALLSSSSTGSR